MTKPRTRPIVGDRSDGDGRDTPRAYNGSTAPVTVPAGQSRPDLCDNAGSKNEAERGSAESNSRLSSPDKETPKAPNMQRLKAVWPEVWKLMRPRRGLLAIGFVLMVINRIAGFVLPYSSKFLIDNVVTKHQIGLLRPLVFAVLIATLIQGVTSFCLTQLLSKAGQRLIAELGAEVQKHISRLP